MYDLNAAAHTVQTAGCSGNALIAIDKVGDQTLHCQQPYTMICHVQYAKLVCMHVYHLTSLVRTPAP